jgi:hypothetical protein
MLKLVFLCVNMKKAVVFYLICLLCLKHSFLYGQEVFCEFAFNFPNAPPTEKAALEQLDRAIREFTNTRKWTTDNYKPVEKVRCTFQFLIDRYENNRFECKELVFIASRPVFNSAYTTTLISIRDKYISFEYQQGQNIEFNEGSFVTNITSLVGYYVYIALGLDRDSFSEMGGTSMYNKARAIVQNCQSVGAEKGWRANDDIARQTRYWLVDQLLDNAYKDLRIGMYEYHLKGLDVMADKGSNAGREAIMACIEKYYNVNMRFPGLYIVAAFLDAKQIELVNVLRGADAGMKSTFLEKMSRLDPVNLNKYNQINQQ